MSRAAWKIASRFVPLPVPRAPVATVTRRDLAGYSRNTAAVPSRLSLSALTSTVAAESAGLARPSSATATTLPMVGASSRVGKPCHDQPRGPLRCSAG